MSWQRDHAKEEENFDYSEAKTESTLRLFVVDCSESMRQEVKMQKTLIELVSDYIYKSFKKHIIEGSGKMMMGVILYNVGWVDTDTNNLTAEHVAKFVNIDKPSARNAKMIRELPELLSVKGSAPPGQSADARNILEIAQYMIGNSKAKKYDLKQISILTNDDMPGCTDRDALMEKRHTMVAGGAEFNIFQLKDDWNPDSLWDKIHVKYEDEPVTGIKLEDYTDDPLEDFRKRIYAKRSLTSTQIMIGDPTNPDKHFAIAVKLFCQIRRAPLPQPQWRHGRTHQPLVRKTRWVCADTREACISEAKENGEEDIEKVFREANSKAILDATEIEKHHKFGSQKAPFVDTEIAQIKDIGTVGLTLLGFKKRSRLKDWQNWRASYFMHPDETTMEGASLAFHAFVQALSDKQRIAIFMLKARKSAPCYLVAGVPLAEEQETDEDGKPTGEWSVGGMHIIFLPYADDIRNVKPNLPDEDDPNYQEVQANEDLVDAAVAIIKKSVHLVNKFEPTADQKEPHEPDIVSLTDDPAKQRFYDVLESLALNEGIPQRRPDLTDPDPTIASKLESEGFLDKFFDKLPDADEVAVGKKRKKPAIKGASKRQKKADGGDDEKEELKDIESMAKAGTLKKLKVADLKKFLKSKNLEVKGKKADLINRIENFFDG